MLTIANPGQACCRQTGPEVPQGIGDKVALAVGGVLCFAVCAHLLVRVDLIKLMGLFLPHLQAQTGTAKGSDEPQRQV